MVQLHLSERMIGQGSGVNAAEDCSYKTKVLYARTSPVRLVSLIFNWRFFVIGIQLIFGKFSAK
jgi:hypothetical protein